MISFGTNFINIVITNYLEKEKPFLEIAVREKGHFYMTVNVYAAISRFFA